MELVEVLEVVKTFVEEKGNDGIKELKDGLKEILVIDRGEGRKKEVRDILEDGGRYSIREIGERLGISDKNVSSILTYLRKSGLKICTDSDGRKFIEK